MTTAPKAMRGGDGGKAVVHQNIAEASEPEAGNAAGAFGGSAIQPVPNHEELVKRLRSGAEVKPSEAADAIEALLAERNDWRTAAEGLALVLADKDAALARKDSALRPFARFLDVLETMGGNTPRSGTYYGISSSAKGDAELTVEDFLAVRQALETKDDGAAS